MHPGFRARDALSRLAIISLLASSPACASSSASQTPSSPRSACRDSVVVEVSVPGLAGESEFVQVGSASLASDLQHGLQDALRVSGSPCPPAALELIATPESDGRFWVDKVARSSGDPATDNAISALVSSLGPFTRRSSGTAGSYFRISIHVRAR